MSDTVMRFDAIEFAHVACLGNAQKFVQTIIYSLKSRKLMENGVKVEYGPHLRTGTADSSNFPIPLTLG